MYDVIIVLTQHTALYVRVPIRLICLFNSVLQHLSPNPPLYSLHQCVGLYIMSSVTSHCVAVCMWWNLVILQYCTVIVYEANTTDYNDSCLVFRHLIATEKVDFWG